MGHGGGDPGNTTHTLFQLNEKLAMISPTATTVGTPSTLEPLGGGRLRLMAPGGGSAIGEVVRFVEENGAVTRMYVGDGYQTRLR